MSKKGEKNIVKLIVNGNPSNILLKLGAMGEVFFVEKTRERVKRHFQTSPFHGEINNGIIDNDHKTQSNSSSSSSSCKDEEQDGNKNIYNSSRVPLKINAPTTTVESDELCSHLSRLRSFSDGDVGSGSCGKNDSPRTR